MRGEMWRHLQHVGHAADVPAADGLIEGRRLKEHLTAHRHAPHGMRKDRRGEEERKEGHSVRSQYTAVLIGSGSTSECVMC